MFTSLEELKEFEFKSGYGGREKAFDFKKRRIQNFDTIAEGLLDIKIHDEIKQTLDKQISAHLQKLEKEKRIIQNKVETLKRLAQKGLVPPIGEKSGKIYQWGDKIR